jgi:hypothetical protein
MKKAEKSKNVTTEDLAVMVQKGFSDLENRLGGKIDGLENRIDVFEDRVNRKFDQLSNRIDDLALNRATWQGLKIVEARVQRIEKRLHISLK